MELLAQASDGFWSYWLYPIFMFLLGLGAVVFVHELGHFLVAKFVGIRVERFALGMGPRVVGLKVGETDYCICLLPLGGYVKMLGQEDFKPLEENETPDPRSFESKSVGARFAVISAGVIMNVIFAGILFVILGMTGKTFMAPVIGGVQPNTPAAKALVAWQDAPGATTAPAEALNPHLQAGDELIGFDGDSIVTWLNNGKVPHFGDVKMAAVLSDPGQTFKITVARQVGDRRHIGVTEVASARIGDNPVIGLLQPTSNEVAGLARGVKANTPLQEGDRIVAINGQAVGYLWDIERIQKTLTGRAVDVTVARGSARVDLTIQPIMLNASDVYILTDGRIIQGEPVSPSPQADDEDRKEVLIRQADGQEVRFNDDQKVATLLDILGMQPQIRIETVNEGSPADSVGLLPGDVIVGYGDDGAPTLAKLQEINARVAAQDGQTNIAVLRNGQTATYAIRPKRQKNSGQIGVQVMPDLSRAAVAGIRPASPAAKANIPAGAHLESINGTPVSNWVDVYETLLTLKGRPVQIAYRLGETVQQADLGVLTAEQFDAGHYQFSIFSPGQLFVPMQVTAHYPNPLDALKWGAKETVKLVLSSYVSLRSMIKGNVSVKTVSGPLGIGAMAVSVARESFTDFVYFMAFLSTALAVFNFLPIPVVDGGHAVFLLIEKVRRKPVPVKIMNYVQVGGLMVLLGIFLAVTWQDLVRMLGL